MMRIFSLVIPFFYLSLAAVTSFAGVVIENQDGDTTYFSSGKMKNVPAGRDATVILDLNASIMTVINNQERTYTSSTIKEYCAEIRAMGEEAMAHLSPEQKQMMEQFMAGTINLEAPRVTIQKLGSGGKIAGYQTERYLVLADGEKYEELYLSEKDLPAVLGMDLKKLQAFNREFGACRMGGLALEDIETVENDPAYQQLMERGFPLKTVDFENGRPEGGDQVVSVQKKSIPDSEFKAPSGYRKLDLRTFFQREMQLDMEEDVDAWHAPETDWEEARQEAVPPPAGNAGGGTLSAEGIREEAARSLDDEIKNKIKGGIQGLFGR